MNNDYEQRLQGGHPNSLGETVSIVEEILSSASDRETRMAEFFSCYSSEDQVVRLRVSNGMKRLSKAMPELILPYLDRLLVEIAPIQQASVQWTLAWLFGHYTSALSPKQRLRALELMKSNLEHHEDWIVLNTTLDTLGQWAQEDGALRTWLVSHLERLASDSRKSVAGRAKKVQQKLDLI
jgi:hypothetical protein